jgi:hypothetical protein
VAAAGQVVAVVRRYRQVRAGGADREHALDAALRAALPAPVAFVVRNEARLLLSLVLFAVRRRQGVPPAAVPLSYDRALRPMSLLLLAMAVVELIVIELALPWPTARLVLLILGGCTLVFVLGMTAANIVRPHVVTAECLRLRFGTWADIRVSREKIETAAVSHRAAPGKTISVVGEQLALGVAGMTNVELRLTGPTVLDLGRRSRQARAIRFAADDPRAAVHVLTREAAGIGGAAIARAG